MNKVNLQGSAIRINFKFQIDKDFGKGNFTKEEAKQCAEKAGLSETEFKSIATHVLRHFKVDKNVYSFGDVPPEVKNAQNVQKKTLKKDWDVLEGVPEKKVVSVPIINPPTPPKDSNTVLNLIDEQDDLPFLFGQFIEYGFQALFKLTAELGAGDE